MGTYINPGSYGFAQIVADSYVDKTGLIALMNGVVNTPRSLVCVTRPRRFGKTFAAEAVSAYYSCGCESRALFEGLDISHDPSFEEHLNAYHVVRLDMAGFKRDRSAEAVEAVEAALLAELRDEFDFVSGADGAGLTGAILEVVRATGRKFVFVIDEWDAPIRNATRDEQAGRDYVDFLHGLFKNGNFTAEAVAAAYMTGILPIKHYGTQSALNDFNEYTMIRPFDYAPYVGFTDAEVIELADRFSMSIEDLRTWYDGYELPGTGRVYAPYSVMRACFNGQVGPYWASSEAHESLKLYIDLDFDGLQGDIVRAIGGDELKFDPYMFGNDMHEIHSRDDALELLVHLGYLAFDSETSCARVPNEEVRAELANAVRQSRHVEVARIVRESDQLLRDMWACDGEAVASGIARAHDASCAPLYYNDEQALRAVVKAALISAADVYARVDELPGGHGYADVAYLPKRGRPEPALVVELKWNKSASTAMDQIRARDYPSALRDLDAPVLLVAITYDSKTKAHSCQIEQLSR